MEAITPTTKDNKTFIPAVISFFQNMESKFVEMIEAMKSEFQRTCSEKDAKIVGLEGEVRSLKKNLLKLEERVEDNDSYERRDTLVFSGPAVPPATATEKCSETVVEILRRKLDLNISKEEISVAHRHGKEKKSIIVKLCHRSNKSDIVSSAKTVRPPNLYISECLTPQRETIAYVLRRAKREFPAIIASSTTMEGKNFVWVKPPNPTAPGAKNVKLNVSTYTRLQDFCLRTLEKPVTHFVKEWKH